MSRYLVAVRYGDSRGYLMLGRIVAKKSNATHYPHPSNARQAIAGYQTRNPVHCARVLHIFHIVDTRTR